MSASATSFFTYDGRSWAGTGRGGCGVVDFVFVFVWDDVRAGWRNGRAPVGEAWFDEAAKFTGISANRRNVYRVRSCRHFSRVFQIVIFTHLPLETCRVEAGTATGSIGRIDKDIESGKGAQAGVDVLHEAIVEASRGGCVVVAREGVCRIGDEGHEIKKALERSRNRREEGGM